MITCPKCKTTGIPEDAKFCPNCGTSLCPPETIKQLTVSECRIVPNVIKKGEKCRLIWKGENIEYIEVNSKRYKTSEEIIISPSRSYTYKVSFYGGGSCIGEQVPVVVERISSFLTKRNVLNTDEFLFGPNGERDGISLDVDIRQVERVSGIGKLSEFKLKNIQWPKDIHSLYIYLCEGRWGNFFIEATPQYYTKTFSICGVTYKNSLGCLQIHFNHDLRKVGFLKHDSYLHTSQIWVRYEERLSEDKCIEKFTDLFYLDLMPFKDILLEFLGENPVDLDWWTDADDRKIS